MKHVIFFDPAKDPQMGARCRSLSPKHLGKKISPKQFEQNVYNKLINHMKKKEIRLEEKRKQKEKEFEESIKPIMYSEKWTKDVKCHNDKPFLDRAQENIKLLWERQAKNDLQRLENKEKSVNECTFHPQIDQMAHEMGPRSIKDWYEWDRKREEKRKEKQMKRDREEMKECAGRFRSPKSRKRLEKEHKKK